MDRGRPNTAARRGATPDRASWRCLGRLRALPGLPYAMLRRIIRPQQPAIRRIPVKGCSQSCGQLPNPRGSPMQSMIRRSARFLATSVSFVLFLSAATAEDMHKSAGSEAKEILKTNETVVGGPLKYPPTDKPEVTSIIVTIQPGGHSNLHQHPVVTLVHVWRVRPNYI